MHGILALLCMRLYLQTAQQNESPKWWISRPRVPSGGQAHVRSDVTPGEPHPSRTDCCERSSTPRWTKTGSFRVTLAEFGVRTGRTPQSDRSGPWRRSSRWPTRCATGRLRALILLSGVHHPAMERGDCVAPLRGRAGRELGPGRVAHTELIGRGIVVGPPKSRAGSRTVSVPRSDPAEIVKHLMTYVDHGRTRWCSPGRRAALSPSALQQPHTLGRDGQDRSGASGAALPRPAAHRQPPGRADRRDDRRT